MSDSDQLSNDDGRRARRDRNRFAVVDAYLDLVRAGNPRPSIAEVAELSSISHRSVFRYFADRDELARTAIERQHAFVKPLLALTVGPGAAIEERVAGFVGRRLDLYEALGPVARLSRSLAGSQPIIAAELTASRAFYRGQIVHLFRVELDSLGPDDARLAVAALDALCSFESVELLRTDQGLSHGEAAAALARSIRAILRGD